MSEDRLRDAYARVLEERRGESGRDACPSVDAIAALVRREGREASRLATLDHVMACPRCQREFELLRAIEEAGGDAARPAATPARWHRWAPVALAASLLLGVGLVAASRLSRAGRDPLRSAGAEVALVAPAADSAVDAGAPVVLAWHPVEGASRYVVEMLSIEGELAFEGETADTTLIVAAPPIAGEYRWLVRAQADDGTDRRSVARAIRVRDE